MGKRLRGRGWIALKRQVLIRDGYRCQLRLQGCTDRATQPDHIIPVMDGGTDTLDNLQAACSSCNRRKGVTPQRFFSEQAAADARFRRIPPFFAPIRSLEGADAD